MKEKKQVNLFCNVAKKEFIKFARSRLQLFLPSSDSNCFYQDSSPESDDDYDDDSNVEVDLTYEPSSDDDAPIPKKSRKVGEPTQTNCNH